MAESKKPDMAKNNATTEPTRRNVLITMASVGVSGMLSEEAEAHTRRYHATPRVTSVQKQNFLTAVHTFNNMGTIPNDNNNPFLQVLDPNVTIFDVTLDHQKLQGPPLSYVVAGLYSLLGLINGHWFPQFDPHYYGEPDYTQHDKVTGFALWSDSDGTSPEKIHYTFRFKGDLLVALHAR